MTRTTLVYYFFLLSNLFAVYINACSKTQCLNFRKENDVSTKAQLLIAEKGVRIVYFTLNISSYSYQQSDRIMPTRWTWAQSNKEPLLALSYDYDVLSLSLLTNQAKDLTLDLTSAQSQCIKALNSTCQDLEIAKALLDITNHDNPQKTSKTDVICFRVLNEHAFGFGSHFKYQCCKDHEENMPYNGNETVMDCNVPVSESRWLAVFNAILAILVGVTVLYLPWIFYLLPNVPYENDCVTQTDSTGSENVCMATIVNKTDHANTESSTNIPSDDFSPITLKNLLEKLGDLFPDIDLRAKLFLFWFGVIPIFFYIKLILYFIIKTSFDDTARKLLFQVADVYLFVFNMKRPLVYVFFVVPFFVIPGVAIFVVCPQNVYRSIITATLESVENLKTYMKKSREKCFGLTEKFLLRASKSKVFGNSSCGKNPIPSLYSVIYIIIIVPISTITAVLIFLLITVLCLFFCAPYFSLLKRLGVKSYISFLMIYTAISTTILVIFSSQFLVRMLGFVIMGIILNAEFVVPYMTFAFVLARNIYLCFCNTQNKYKELKDSIAEKLQPKDGTIPAKLFWCVSDRVLPLTSEIYKLLFKILAILVFLSVALTAILLFKVTYGASAIVPTISVFLSGKFSELFFTGVTTGSTLVGWHKIRSEEEITSVVEDYLQSQKHLAHLKQQQQQYKSCLVAFHIPWNVRDNED